MRRHNGRQVVAAPHQNQRQCLQEDVEQVKEEPDRWLVRLPLGHGNNKDPAVHIQVRCQCQSPRNPHGARCFCGTAGVRRRCRCSDECLQEQPDANILKAAPAAAGANNPRQHCHGVTKVELRHPPGQTGPGIVCFGIARRDGEQVSEGGLDAGIHVLQRQCGFAMADDDAAGLLIVKTVVRQLF